MLTPASEVLDILDSSYNELVAQERDYLSFATVLEVHLSNAYHYTDEEGHAILNKLSEVLSKDEELVQEIGWDIPSMVLKFVPSKNYFFDDILRSNPKVKLLFAVFDVLAKHGNPKEIFLRCCEILESLGFHDDNTFYEEYVPLDEIRFVDDELKEKTLNFKFHLIFELLRSTFRRITTLYPLRFLAMIVASTLKYYTNNLVYLLNPSFALRRIYTFIRDYLPPRTPGGVVLEDEKYLQRKLLQSFLTECIEIVCRYFLTDFALDFFRKAVEQRREPLPTPGTAGAQQSVYISESLEQMDLVLERCHELALACDIDYKSMLKENILATADRMFAPVLSILAPESPSLEFEERVTNLISDICNKEFAQRRKEGEIPISGIGVFLLYTVFRRDGGAAEDLIGSCLFEEVVMTCLKYFIPILTVREGDPEPPIEAYPKIAREDEKDDDQDENDEMFDDEGTQNDTDIENGSESENETLLEEVEDAKERVDKREEQDKLSDESFKIYLRNINTHYKANIKDHYFALQDALIYWCWRLIGTLGRAEQILNMTKLVDSEGKRHVMPVIAEVFLLSLLTFTVNLAQSESPRSSEYRKVILTLVIRFLSMSDESFAWRFLMRSLETCPYLPVKVSLTHILKDMCSRKKGVSVDIITKGLSKMEVNDPPKLPPRANTASPYFINLDEVRKVRLLRMINSTLDEVFGDLDVKRVDTDSTQLMLTYLNLVYHLRASFTIDELSDLLEKLEATVSTREDSDNNVVLMKLFVEQLKKHIDNN